jgi:Fur family iron response transcriptional regulator
MARVGQLHLLKTSHLDRAPGPTLRPFAEPTPSEDFNRRAASTHGCASPGNTGVCFGVAPAYVYSMKGTAPLSTAFRRLREAGLRPTRQRLALAQLLRQNGDRHVTAEQLHGEAVTSGIPVSLATVYNTLHQFSEAGLLRETVVEPGRSYFDTNTADHHHFFCEATGQLQDIPAQQLLVSGLPLPPAGTEIRRVDIIVRIRPDCA